MSYMAVVLMTLSLWISPGKSQNEAKLLSKLHDCLDEVTKHIVVPEKFDGIISAQKFLNTTTERCIIFVRRVQNGQELRTPLEKDQLHVMTKDDADLLYISPLHVQKKLLLDVKRGTGCSNHTGSSECRGTSVNTTTMCANSAYEGNNCTKMLVLFTTAHAPSLQQREPDALIQGAIPGSRAIRSRPLAYRVNREMNSQNKHCRNCNNPVKKPDIQFILNLFTNSSDEEELSPAQAIEVMNQMSEIAKNMTVNSAELNIGKGASGVIVKEHHAPDIKQVSLAYVAPSAGPNIIYEGEDLDLGGFSRSVSMPKEAFEKALSSNVSAPFVVVCRFHNMTKDEKNSTVLGNEIVAIEMGTVIKDLKDKIKISFQNVQYEGIPSCHSWNGQGSKPQWTDSGCVTVAHGDNITCQCSHLTFFAILLTPLNETISSSDLKKLTVITQVGCALSMLFLGIVLFLHFLLRKTKATDSITLLIHLVLAIFFLDLTFLVNHHVESLDNSVGCKIMAAAMHYFLLATFVWFTVQAFHLCLQLSVGGKVDARHYVLRFSICGWGLPLVVVIVLLSVGKYGAQDINTSDTDETVTMCWITDSTVHWVVNIGCYALVFMFTFTTFITMLTLLIRHSRANTGSENTKRNGKNVFIIFGLCSILGVSWGFVFFAYGVLRIPAYYIFTILSSFQGFFLFVFYYHTRDSGEIYDSSSNQTTTTNTSSSIDGKVS